MTQQPNPTVERMMFNIDRWCRSYCSDQCVNSREEEAEWEAFTTLRTQIAAMVEEIEALKLEVRHKESVISMTVARLGDCRRVDFLQRIDRLVQMEREAKP